MHPVRQSVPVSRTAPDAGASQAAANLKYAVMFGNAQSRTSLGRFTRRNGSVLPDGVLWPLGKKQDPEKIAQKFPERPYMVLNLMQQRVQESITVRHYSRKPVRP